MLKHNLKASSVGTLTILNGDRSCGNDKAGYSTINTPGPASTTVTLETYHSQLWTKGHKFSYTCVRTGACCLVYSLSTLDCELRLWQLGVSLLGHLTPC